MLVGFSLFFFLFEMGLRANKRSSLFGSPKKKKKVPNNGRGLLWGFGVVLLGFGDLGASVSGAFSIPGLHSPTSYFKTHKNKVHRGSTGVKWGLKQSKRVINGVGIWAISIAG